MCASQETGTAQDTADGAGNAGQDPATLSLQYFYSELTGKDLP
jgi:hypothetical protein